MRAIWMILLGTLLFSCRSQNLFQSNQKLGIKDLMATVGPLQNHQLNVGDKITLSIWEHENLSVGSIYGMYNSNEVFGKWLQLDTDGAIFLPKVGMLRLGGMTIREAEKYISNTLDTLLVNPVVTIQVLNHEVSILGQVIKPGVYTLDREHSTIHTLIAEAGGLDFYANIKKSVLVRGNVEYELDLSSLRAMDYNQIPLAPGDVLYIPTKGGKILDKKAPTLIGATSVITTILLIFSTLNN